MLGRNQYKALLTIYFAIAASIALPAVLLEVMLMSSNILMVFKISTLVLFVANVVISVNWQRMPLYHPYVLFLGAFAYVFILPLVFDVVQLDSLSVLHQFPDIIFSDHTQMRMLISVYLALVGAQAGAIWSQKKTQTLLNITTDFSWLKVGLFFFYIGLPFLIYQYLSTGLEVQAQGYAAKVLGQLDTQSSLLTIIMAQLSYAGFLIYLASFHRSRWFYVHLALFVLVLCLQLLMQEYKVFISTFFILAFFLFLHNRRLRERFIFLPVGLALLGTVLVHFIEESPTVVDAELFKAQSARQSETLESLGFTIDSLSHIPFTLRHLADGVQWQYAKGLALFSNDTVPYAPVEVLQAYELLDYRLSYLMDKSAMQQGHLIKSTYVSELYAIFGGVAVFIGHFLLGLFLVLGVDRMLRSRLGVLILLLILPSVVFVPTSLLDFAAKNMFLLLPLLFIMALAVLYKKAFKKRTL